MPANHSKLGSRHLKGINNISGCDSGLSHFSNDKSPFLHLTLHVSHPKGRGHNEVKLVILCVLVIGFKESQFILEKWDCVVVGGDSIDQSKLFNQIKCITIPCSRTMVLLLCPWFKYSLDSQLFYDFTWIGMSSYYDNKNILIPVSHYFSWPSKMFND